MGQIEETWRAYCIDSSEAGFTPFYEATHRLVWTICYRLTRNDEDASDALQAAYCRLLSIPAPEAHLALSQDSTDSNMEMVVKSIAVREADALRKRRGRRLRKETSVENLGIPTDPSQNPSEVASREQTSRMLEMLISELPDAFRDPLLLHYFHEMTHREISQALGVPASTVTNRIKRALAQLKPRARRLGLSEVLTTGVLTAAASGHLLYPPSSLAATEVFQAASSSIAASGGSSFAAASTKLGLVSKLAALKGTGVGIGVGVGLVIMFFIAMAQRPHRPSHAIGLLSPPPALRLKSPNEQANGYFARSMTGLRDMDGDSVGDVIVGAMGEDTSAKQSGRIYLYSGATSALIRTLQSPNPEAKGYFGRSVSGVPDVNLDGYDEILVGAPWEARGIGRAYLFDGKTGTLLHVFNSPNPLETDIPAGDGGNFGWSVTGLPSVRGEQHGDVVVGASREHGGAAHAGRVYVFNGKTGALICSLQSPNPESEGPQGGPGEFGAALGAVLINGPSSLGNVIIGAPGEDSSERDSGSAYAFDASRGKLIQTFRSPNPVANGGFGFAIATYPDPGGSENENIVIGTKAENGREARSGRAYVFNNGRLVFPLDSPNPQPDGWFGSAISVVPNADSSRSSGILIGSFFENRRAEGAGAAYLFSGKTGVLLRIFESPRPQNAGSCGFAIAGFPSHGDGMGGIAIGAYGESPDGSPPLSGRAYIFKGTNTSTIVEGPAPANRRVSSDYR